MSTIHVTHTAAGEKIPGAIRPMLRLELASVPLHALVKRCAKNESAATHLAREMLALLRQVGQLQKLLSAAEYKITQADALIAEFRKQTQNGDPS